MKSDPRRTNMNRRTLATLLATTLAALSLAGFATGCKDVGNFTNADSGKTFTTAPGALLHIQLKGNYTTGYTWDVADADPSIVRLNEAKYVPDQPQRAGSGGVQHYAFDITGKGQTTLKIICHRPWEKNTPPIMTFILRIDSK
jgi:inhibitor of cysteine peptidase